MANKTEKIKFKGMSYREVQYANSRSRSKLHQEDIKWLKDNSYKNVGWDNLINLYQKIEEFLDKYQLKELTLEELFLEADRIGNKYLSMQEIQEFSQKLSQEVNGIAEVVDQQFPDTEAEIIDFSEKTNNSFKKQRNQKLYRTIRV